MFSQSFLCAAREYFNETDDAVVIETLTLLKVEDTPENFYMLTTKQPSFDLDITLYQGDIYSYAYQVLEESGVFNLINSVYVNVRHYAEETYGLLPVFDYQGNDYLVISE